MPLLSCGEPVVPNSRVPLTVQITSHPQVVKATEEFHRSPVRSLSRRVIYVAQHEWCGPVFPADADWIGSEDATTCAVIALRSVSSGCCAVGHFDSRESVEASLATMIDSITSHKEQAHSSIIDEEIDVGIVGCCDGEDGSHFEDSQSTAEVILSLLQASPCKFNMKLACILGLNAPMPGTHEIIRGVAVQCNAAGEASVFAKAAFEDRGPMLEARTAQLWSRSLGTAMVKVFPFPLNGNGNYFVVYPVLFHAKKDRRSFLSLDKATDHELLQFSTTPCLEGPNFCKDIRAAIRFVSSQQLSATSVGGATTTTTTASPQTPWKFIMSSTGTWQSL